MNLPLPSTKRTLKRVGPLSAGKVLARIFHTHEGIFHRKIRPPFRRGDLVAASPDQVGPNGRTPITSGFGLALLYGAMGLLFIPFFLLMAAFASQMPAPQRGVFAFVGMGFAIFIPFFYAAIGFIAGVLTAALYNLAAKWVGGIEVEVE